MSNWISEKLKHGIHAFAGGDGSLSTVVLIPGWPETAEAFSEVFPSLVKSHRTFCVDPPGVGNSAASEAGYDTVTVAKILQRSLRSEIDGTYHLVGHDVGAWIAYAWAAQFRDEVKSLTVIDSSIPGLAPCACFRCRTRKTLSSGSSVLTDFRSYRRSSPPGVNENYSTGFSNIRLHTRNASLESTGNTT